LSGLPAEALSPTRHSRFGDGAAKAGLPALLRKALQAGSFFVGDQ